MGDDKKFFDSVYACWMGKNIGGTLGGPLEGIMELMDVKGYTQTFVEAVENDDLDLQLVNLHCVEQNGGRADMALLSREWLDHVHFEFDEYGHSLTNMRRGFGYPLSGCYNNFFTDCMGSPIRAEIWAVLCAGMPDLAAYYAYHDASVDHAGGEGVYGEIFFAVLESLAFEEKDKFVLIDRALSYLPEDCNVRGAVELLVKCHREGKDWVSARQAIIDRYAGDNFTYAPVNIAFTLIGWLYEEGFTRQMLMTANCGYDTDCTVATLGALLGILYGPGYLDPYWTEPLGENIVVSRPVFGFNAPKTITELTERSIAARKLVQAQYEAQKDKAVFAEHPDCASEVYYLPLTAHREHDLKVQLFRIPTYLPGQTRMVFAEITNLQPAKQQLELDANGGECVPVELEPGETKCVALSAVVPDRILPLAKGELEIRRMHKGMYWNSEFLPLNMIPKMLWKCGEKTLELDTNRIGAELIPEKTETIVLETTLTLTDPGAATLKLACANPLRVWLDEEEIIDCDEKTIVIPAYHRADPRKCAELPEGPGKHRLKVEIGDGADFEEFYFMVVSPEFYWAYRLDATFTLE